MGAHHFDVGLLAELPQAIRYGLHREPISIITEDSGCLRVWQFSLLIG